METLLPSKRSNHSILMVFTLFGDINRFRDDLNYYSQLLTDSEIPFRLSAVVFHADALPDDLLRWKNIKYIKTPILNGLRKLDRYFGLRFLDLDSYSMVSVRDLDSRLTGKEYHVISRFLESNHIFCTVRDGEDQCDPIMAGNFYFKPAGADILIRGVESQLFNTFVSEKFRSDQIVLSKVYKAIRHGFVAFTSCYTYLGERTIPLAYDEEIIGAKTKRTKGRERLKQLRHIKMPLCIYRLCGNRNFLFFLQRLF
jgi:hypothetical protein